MLHVDFLSIDDELRHYTHNCCDVVFSRTSSDRADLLTLDINISPHSLCISHSSCGLRPSCVLPAIVSLSLQYSWHHSCMVSGTRAHLALLVIVCLWMYQQEPEGGLYYI